MASMAFGFLARGGCNVGSDCAVAVVVSCCCVLSVWFCCGVLSVIGLLWSALRPQHRHVAGLQGGSHDVGVCGYFDTTVLGEDEL